MIMRHFLEYIPLFSLSPSSNMVFCFRFCYCSVEAQARAELFYLSILSKTFNNYHFLVERLSTEETISLQTLLWLFKHPVLCKPFFLKDYYKISCFSKCMPTEFDNFYYHISSDISVVVHQKFI